MAKRASLCGCGCGWLRLFLPLRLLLPLPTAGARSFRTNLYGSGQHWADYTQGTGSGSGSTEYRLGDEVGTLFYTIDENGNAVESCLSYPFGESLSCNPSIDYTENHYSDKKRDQESNLDYFGARFYSSTLGRFMTPDEPFANFDQKDPQSFNMYSYVQKQSALGDRPGWAKCPSVRGRWERRPEVRQSEC